MPSGIVLQLLLVTVSFVELCMCVCPAPFESVPKLTNQFCYSLANISDGLHNLQQSWQMCQEMSFVAYPVVFFNVVRLPTC